MAAAASCLAWVASSQDAPTTTNPDITRDSIQKWVETRRTIAQRENDWALSREMLQSRIDIMEDQVKALKETIKTADTDRTEVDQQISEKQARIDELVASARPLVDAIGELERQTLSLTRRLPLKLQEKVQLLTQRIPTKEEDITAMQGKLRERYMNVLGILNEINKFHREISEERPTVTLSTGSDAEVSALYLGISVAYYVSDDHQHAGVGYPTREGWTWKADDSIAPQVDQALAIYRNEKVAEFIPLPVDVKE